MIYKAQGLLNVLDPYPYPAQISALGGASSLSPYHVLVELYLILFVAAFVDESLELVGIARGRDLGAQNGLLGSEAHDLALDDGAAALEIDAVEADGGGCAARALRRDIRCRRCRQRWFRRRQTL